MEKLIYEHLTAQILRGTITKETTITDSLEKLNEEVGELQTEAIEVVANGKLTPEFVSESMDVVDVIFNMLTLHNINVAAAYEKHLIKQQTRED